MAFEITQAEKEAIASMYEWALQNSHSFFFVRCFQRTHMAKKGRAVEEKLEMEWECRWMEATDIVDHWESYQVGPVKTLQELRTKMADYIWGKAPGKKLKKPSDIETMPNKEEDDEDLL